ncbi:hypothetical protein GCM10011585_10400 [Edaphobacter dinghuensis]|uniref:Uncharacterized protein n=1 Tax=Edaphobacter dinghuensis TaxID=1560005 RepID=A0A917H7N3_9BACT|nr:hypothetical protein GCM10011585_10400 [Edaphobacter dinghuensis]
MQIEHRLFCRGERPVKRVGQHRLALSAVPGFPGLGRLCASELVELCHLHHLPFYQSRYFLLPVLLLFLLPVLLAFLLPVFLPRFLFSIHYFYCLSTTVSTVFLYVAKASQVPRDRD